MSLETQISLMTVPQEFSRLCSAILSADHGDDFLPIDDDRADAGNDGYLKSEQRLFAVHCFKRADKQGIEAEIRRKMIGDFGKAEALNREGIWKVAAWTFISNYAIPERVAARMLELGRAAGIEVSWKGPAYLAEGLRRHPSVRQGFPNLDVTDVSAKLEALGDEMRDLAGAAPPNFWGVPTTPAERQRLIATRPPGWEYLLYAGLLVEGRDALAFKWRDHELRIPRGAPVVLDDTAAAPWLSDAFRRVSGTMEPLMRPFEPDAQATAFGAPGEPGDPAAIEHFARRTIIAYETLLDWAAEVRAAAVSPRFARMFELAAEYVDTPLRRIREFIAYLAEQTAKIPEHVRQDEAAGPERPRTPLFIEAELILSIDADLQREMDRETRRVRRKMRWGI